MIHGMQRITLIQTQIHDLNCTLRDTRPTQPTETERSRTCFRVVVLF